MRTKAFIRNHIAKLRNDAIFTTREMLGYGKRAYVDWALWEMVVAVGIRVAPDPPHGSARALLSACGSYLRF